MGIRQLTWVALVFACLSCGSEEGSGATNPVAESTSAELSAVHEAPVDLLTLEEKVGQLIIIDLYNEQGSPILELSESDEARIADLAPGGVIYYGANLDTVEQTRSVTVALQNAAEIPLFIAIDHEGGIVNRLDDSGRIHATTLPSAKIVGLHGDPEWTRLLAGVMAKELNALGINMNFAPVADIASNSESVIGSRSYGTDPVAVANMVSMAVLGLQENGVSSVLKHFPGHGAALGDTHTGLVYLPKSLADLSSFEFIPFAAGILAGVDAIMVAHIVVGLPEENYLPATLSSRILTGGLRGELGFEGLIVTDSLTMKAMAGIESPAVKALLAGADMILRPDNAAEVKREILAAVDEGVITTARIDESVGRILRIKSKRGIGAPPSPQPELNIGTEEHKMIAEGPG
jgi:beta-N-acetylhexosaminidase